MLTDGTIAEIMQPESLPFVELYELDFNPIGENRILRFCNEQNEKGDNIIWRGMTFDAYPIQSDGFDLTTEGASPQVRLTIANVNNLLTAATEEYDQLVGVVVTRYIVHTKNLDRINFITPTNTPNAMDFHPSMFVIEKQASLDHMVAVFQMTTPADAERAMFPNRTILATTCTWVYRGEECQYKAGPVADEFDVRTTDPKKDMCSKRVLGCMARWGATANLPFGGFVKSDGILS